MDKRKMGILAAILMLAITLTAAFFVIKSYVWSSDAEDVPAAPATIAPAPADVAQMQVGILLSDFSATGPHRQANPYGYQTQIRILKSLRDPAIRLVPVVEANTANRPQLARIISQNFSGTPAIEVTNDEQMKKLDALAVIAAADLRPRTVKAIEERVRDGLGFLERQPGYIVPGYSADINDLCGFTDGVFGWNADAVECEVVGDHPLLGDLSGQLTKTIHVVPNGTVGRLKGIPLLRVKQMKDVKLVAADHTVGTGEYLYPLYISQLGKGKIVGIGFNPNKDLPEELNDANHGRFYIHCVEWLAGKPLN